MSKPIESWFQKFLKRLAKRYRFVILNDDTFEERYSLRLRPVQVFTWAGLTVIGLIALTTLLIAFTPLREYIPGYSGNTGMRRKLMLLSEKVDSLETNAQAKDKLLENIRQVISGSNLPENVNTRNTQRVIPEPAKLEAGKDEKAFREEVEKADRFNLNQTGKGNVRLSAISSYYFFAPLKGKVTTAFNASLRHYGVDVVAPKNEAVKATLNGTVIFAGWTTETGYVIHLQHENNLISIYKHNAVLLKKEGDTVKAGEAIAITGNSGELTSSPHLHFELWFDGKPIDPQDFIVF
ncbi:MAG: M23 family metallopeptidase [Bacteroidia bacterium]|jgi:murein DD-endopeptidase MepM/ murein hydrolase activator NlpD|nr:M23 family metallopeptidase [Bacteroidia bacterium]MCC6768698.1 M23 family metallopeptidase [Bacteroidia bacterium]